MKKIFYVEDDMHRASFDKEDLTDLGYKIFHSKTYNDAVEVLSKDSPFDIYIIDGMFPRSLVESPEILADELAREIRKVEPNKPIVCQSTASGLENRFTGLNVICKNKRELAKEWINEILGGNK